MPEALSNAAARFVDSLKDIVGRANQSCQPGENKTTSDEASGPDFPPWALPRSRCYARPPKTAGLNHLPANERRNSQTNFSRAPNQGKGECAVTRNTKQTPDHQIAAFLHSQSGWNCECR